jgi:nitrate/nitrite transport system substrate-binding protein
MVARSVAADRDRPALQSRNRRRSGGLTTHTIGVPAARAAGTRARISTNRFGTMARFDNRFLRLNGCACGRHRSQTEHDAELACTATATEDASHYERVVASALLRAIMPQDLARRTFLRTVGASTALAALAQFFPLKTATELLAQGAGALEKKSLKVGFIPITCATPIIMAHPMGFYARHGLDVEVVKTAGWAVIRDKTLNKEYDAAHMLAPMPVAISLGLGSQPIPFTVPAIENINGQGITLAIKHKDKRDPKQWKGFKFAIPFDYSIHNYLLRYYLAEHGIDPESDVQLRVVPPPEMVANLRADNIDGFLAPDNICQRAIYDGVGFLHILSKEIWDGHPCCAIAVSREFITQAPNSYAALVRAIVDATAFASKAENRKQIAAAIAPANYLNQPEIVLEQVLTGTFADGLGNVKSDPKRVDFDPFPWQSFAIWMMTQMKRWGQIKGDVDYKTVAEQVFLATDTAKLMQDMGLTPPASAYKSFTVMGKTFDPAQPEDYVKSFALKRV